MLPAGSCRSRHLSIAKQARPVLSTSALEAMAKEVVFSLQTLVDVSFRLSVFFLSNSYSFAFFL